MLETMEAVQHVETGSRRPALSQDSGELGRLASARTPVAFAILQIIAGGFLLEMGLLSAVLGASAWFPPQLQVQVAALQSSGSVESVTLLVLGGLLLLGGARVLSHGIGAYRRSAAKLPATRGV